MKVNQYLFSYELSYEEWRRRHEHGAWRRRPIDRSALVVLEAPNATDAKAMADALFARANLNAKDPHAWAVHHFEQITLGTYFKIVSMLDMVPIRSGSSQMVKYSEGNVGDFLQELVEAK